LIDGAKLVRWFDFQAPLYRLWRDDYDGPLVREVLRLLSECPGSVLLDVACGTGLFSIGIARAGGGREIHGIDASLGMLRVAQKQCGKLSVDKVSLTQGDATALPYPDGRFDVIVAAGLIPCLNDSAPALREFRRVLRPEGHLISVEFDRSSMGPTTRLFFRTMILGYKIVSTLFPRFRYAEGWNTDASTIDVQRYEAELARAGFAEKSKRAVASHLVYWLERSGK